MDVLRVSDVDKASIPTGRCGSCLFELKEGLEICPSNLPVDQDFLSGGDDETHPPSMTYTDGPRRTDIYILYTAVKRGCRSCSIIKTEINPLGLPEAGYLY